jgi:hypothetical protein
MMPPALLLVRIGTGRFLVPLPLFLGWPLLLIGYLLIGLAWLLSMGRAFRLALRLTERRTVMSEERKKVLDLLAEGKITPDEAERLLEKLEPKGSDRPGRHHDFFRKHFHSRGQKNPCVPESQERSDGDLKFLRVVVNSNDGDEVNIRVPLKLIRTGIKLSAVLPSSTNEKLAEKGIHLSELAKLEGEELVEALRDLTVDVDSSGGDTVRIFCE